MSQINLQQRQPLLSTLECFFSPKSDPKTPLEFSFSISISIRKIKYIKDYSFSENFKNHILYNFASDKI